MANLGSPLIGPEPRPDLPSFARLMPPPPWDAISDALEARTSPGDIVIDLHGRGGAVARTAIAGLRRSLSYESTALTRLLAEVVLRPPDIRHFEASLSALAGQPRGETSVRLALNDLYASRCATCRRPVVVDEFVWDVADATPIRKVYRCTVCRDQLGGGEIRSEPTDDEDRARAAAPPDAAAARAALHERFPAPPRARELPDRILDLYPPRALVAIEAILARLETDLRAAPIEAALRLGLVHVLLPATRLNSYPGRVGALKVRRGEVRAPTHRRWRERNPWALFEEGCRLVRGFVQGLEAGAMVSTQARLGTDVQSLLEASANVVLRTGSADRPENAPVRPGSDADPVASGGRSRVRLVLTQPPLRWNAENLSFAYLATAMALGRDAAATLPLDLLVRGTGRGGWGVDAATFRRSLSAVRPVLGPDARVVVLLEAGGAEALVACVLGAVGAGYALTDTMLSETEAGIGGTLEFAPPGVLPATRVGVPRTRANVPLPPLEPAEPTVPFQVADVERAVTDLAVGVLQARGEPARFERVLGEVLVGLDRLGHLRRLVGTRTFAETEQRSERSAELLGLIGELVQRRASPPHVPDAAPITAPNDGAADATGEGDQADEPRAEEPSLPIFEPDELDATDEQDADTDADADSDGDEPPEVAAGAGDVGAAAPTPTSAPVPGARVPPTDAPLPQRMRTDEVGLVLELIFGELRRASHPRLTEIEPGRWWLRDEADISRARPPLADRVEWSVFSLLSTTSGMTEAAFQDRVASMFQAHDTPDDALVRACLDSYAERDEGSGLIRPRDDLQSRHREHSELIGLLTEMGHRLGLRCWIGAGEQRRAYGDRRLLDLLTESEREVYLPLVARGAEDALAATDCIWYLRGGSGSSSSKASFLFEVEWTAMLTEPLLGRGRRIENADHVVRFLVVLPERVELVRHKLARSRLLWQALEDGNWHILKAPHVRTLAEREDVTLDTLAPYLGLDPEIERVGEQLPLFA